MLESVLGIVSGFFDFTSYITDYFKENRIRDTQKRIDYLEGEIASQKRSAIAVAKMHSNEIYVLNNKHSQEMSQLKDDLQAEMNPVVGKRRLQG